MSSLISRLYRTAGLSNRQATGHTPMSRWLPKTKLPAKSQSCGKPSKRREKWFWTIRLYVSVSVCDCVCLCVCLCPQMRHLRLLLVLLYKALVREIRMIDGSCGGLDGGLGSFPGGHWPKRAPSSRLFSASFIPHVFFYYPSFFFLSFLSPLYLFNYLSRFFPFSFGGAKNRVGGSPLWLVRP